MKDIPRLFPIWFLPILVFIAWYVMICASSGCRGGRALGNGSAGTIIIPQTPQEINERNTQPTTPPEIVLPPLEPLAPIPIVPPAKKQPNRAKSKPVLPEPKSAKANPVIINPKPAGKTESFSPTVSSTPKLIPKLIEGDGVVITDNNGKTETKDPEIAGPEKKSFINWSELTYYYLFLFIAIILGWIVYDIIQTYRLRRALDSNPKVKKQAAKKPAKATRASRKKAISKPKPPM